MSRKAGPIAKTSPQDTPPNTLVKPAGLDASLELSDLSAQIVTELAAGLSDSDAIRERYGISEAQWELLKSNKAFRNMLTEAVQTWRGDMNAGQRITKKSEIVLEDSIPVLYEIAHNPELAPAARIDAIKQMSVLAGKTGKEGAGGGSGAGGFALNINIGGGTQPVTVQGKLVNTDE